VQAKAPAHLLEGSWPTEALLAQIAVSKHSEHMPLNRQAVVSPLRLRRCQTRLRFLGQIPCAPSRRKRCGPSREGLAMRVA